MCFLDDKIVIFFTVESTWIACLTAVFFYWCSHAMSLVDWFSRKRDLQRISATSELRSGLGFFSMICLFACASPFLFLFWIVLLWSWLYITVLVGLLFFWVWPAALAAALVGCFILLPGESFVHVFGDLGFALRYLFMRKNYVFWSSFVVIMHLLM